MSISGNSQRGAWPPRTISVGFDDNGDATEQSDSEDLGSDYVESDGRGPGVIAGLNITPSMRKSQHGSRLVPFTERDKVRTELAAPAGRSCLIRGLPGRCGTEFAHCFPRAEMKQKKLMDAIEYNWGLRDKELNLDTRSNVICLDALLHTLHDQTNGGGWMLLPEEDIIDRYYAPIASSKSLKDRNAPPPAMPDNGYQSEQAQVFVYRFVVLNPTVMRHTIITILEDIDMDLPATEAHARHHYFPYDNMPQFTSHLHPRFALLAAGSKVHNVPGAERSRLVQKYPSISKVEAIYVAWTKSPPKVKGAGGNSKGGGPDGDKKPPRDKRDDEDDDNRSNRTGKRQYLDDSRSNTSNKRLRSRNQSPSGSKSKSNAPYTQRGLKDSSGGSSCLSTETLVEHETSAEKRYVWGMTGLKGWIQNLSDEVIEIMDKLDL